MGALQGQEGGGHRHRIEGLSVGVVERQHPAHKYVPRIGGTRRNTTALQHEMCRDRTGRQSDRPAGTGACGILEEQGVQAGQPQVLLRVQGDNARGRRHGRAVRAPQEHAASRCGLLGCADVTGKRRGPGAGGRECQPVTFGGHGRGRPGRGEDRHRRAEDADPGGAECLRESHAVTPTPLWSTGPEGPSQ